MAAIQAVEAAGPDGAAAGGLGHGEGLGEGTLSHQGPWQKAEPSLPPSISEELGVGRSRGLGRCSATGGHGANDLNARLDKDLSQGRGIIFGFILSLESGDLKSQWETQEVQPLCRRDAYPPAPTPPWLTASIQLWGLHACPRVGAWEKLPGVGQIHFGQVEADLAKLQAAPWWGAFHPRNQE